jgi:Transcription factor WhiB
LPGSFKWSEAKCLSVDIKTDDIFFSEDEIDQFEATEFCNGTIDGELCPIRNQCLLFALSNNIEYGVFGGMTPLSRKALKKKLPSVKQQPNKEWKFMTQEEALSGLSIKEVNDIKRSLSDA